MDSHSTVLAESPALPRARKSTMRTFFILALFVPLFLALPSAAATIMVNAGGDFQAALNAAQPGDTIYLQCGATFTGNFLLPNKSGSSYITIRTTAPNSRLPAPGQRIFPAYAYIQETTDQCYPSLLPKIVTNNSLQAIRTLPYAHHYQFIGVEIAQGNSSVKVDDLVSLGSDPFGNDPAQSGAPQTNLAVVPHDLIFDRCYIHADSNGQAKRGIALHSASTNIINSYISGFRVVGQEAQAIAGYNGPGPFNIINNYIEGAGENIMFGGSTPAIQNLIPSDIVIKGNLLSKPTAWRGVYTVKNLFELKNAQRVTVSGNILEYDWADGQTARQFCLRCEGKMARRRGLRFRMSRSLTTSFGIAPAAC